MLTYSISFNKVISIPPLKKLVTAKIIENLCNTTTFIPKDFKSFFPLSYPGDRFEEWLTEHREETIRISNDFIKENHLPSMFKNDFKESIYLFCRANVQVFDWQFDHDPIGKIDNLGAILFNAQSYFTVDGEFDDLAWTKDVVLDPVYPILPRFYIACNYCLEYETSLLWSDIKGNDSLHNNGDLSDYSYHWDPLVTFMFFQLKKQIEDPVDPNWQFTSKVYEDLFESAALNDYYYGTRYFWEKIVKPEKIIEDGNFFNLFNFSVEKTNVFLYSQLSKKQKQNFLEWSIGESGCPYHWITLLLSPYTEAERSDIVELVCKLPLDEISSILVDIAGGNEINKLPLYREEVMMALWTPLSEEKKGKVLMKSPIILEYLVETNQFDIVDYMMHSLSLKQKEEHLFVNPQVVKMLEVRYKIGARNAALQGRSSLETLINSRC